MKKRAFWLLVMLVALTVFPACFRQGEVSLSTPDPARLVARVSLVDSVDDGTYAQMLGRVRSKEPKHISTVLHAIRFEGPDFKVYQDAEEACSFLQLLTNESLSNQHLGGFGLIKTPYGVRAITVPRPRAYVESSQQSHDLQILATFAALGVPLTQPIEFSSGSTATVQDLLDDAILTFSFDRKEIEWSALSLVLYLPPEKTWVNKFGKEYDFDSLCEYLLGKSFNATCSGTHLLYCMTALFLVDQKQQLLRSENATRLKDRLEEVSRYLQQTQHADGFWEVNWFFELEGQPLEDVSEAEMNEQQLVQLRVNRVLATGHHLEWLMLLPPEMRPTDECFFRGSRWLQGAVLSESREVIANNYCPYTHAVNAVRLLKQSREPKS